jgi:hypothetical protein
LKTLGGLRRAPGRFGGSERPIPEEADEEVEEVKEGLEKVKQ